MRIQCVLFFFSLRMAQSAPLEANIHGPIELCIRRARGSTANAAGPGALFSTARVLWCLAREGDEVFVQDSVMLEKEAKSLVPFLDCARRTHVAFHPKAGDSPPLRGGSGVSISSNAFTDLNV